MRATPSKTGVTIYADNDLESDALSAWRDMKPRWPPRRWYSGQNYVEITFEDPPTPPQADPTLPATIVLPAVGTWVRHKIDRWSGVVHSIELQLGPAGIYTPAILVVPLAHSGRPKHEQYRVRQGFAHQALEPWTPEVGEWVGVTGDTRVGKVASLLIVSAQLDFQHYLNLVPIEFHRLFPAAAPAPPKPPPTWRPTAHTAPPTPPPPAVGSWVRVKDGESAGLIGIVKSEPLAGFDLVCIESLEGARHLFCPVGLEPWQPRAGEWVAVYPGAIRGHVVVGSAESGLGRFALIRTHFCDQWIGLDALAPARAPS